LRLYSSVLSSSKVCCISRFCWLLLVSASLLSSLPADYSCSLGCYVLMASTILPPSTFVLASAALLSSPSCWLRLLSWFLSADGFYHSATLKISAGFCRSDIFPLLLATADLLVALCCWLLQLCYLPPLLLNTVVLLVSKS